MTLRHTSLRRLRVFEAVARHRSYSRAAAELHLHRYRGLGEVQFGRCTRERQLARNRLEYLQLAQGGVPECHPRRPGWYIN